MRLAEFRGGADPARADHKQNLRQNEIAQCQRLFKGGALLFNVAFCAIELGCHYVGALMPTVQAFDTNASNASQQPNPLAILSAALVRCEIRGGGFCRRRMRCSSQSPTPPLRATPPRARVARKTSATATERRLPRRLKLRVRRKRKSISDRELGAHRARHDHRHQSWPEHDR